MSRRRPLTWREKEDRALARRAGQRALVYLRHTLDHQREADAWHALAAQAGVNIENVLAWQQRADRAREELVQAARRAWHLAQQLEGEAARR